MPAAYSATEKNAALTGRQSRLNGGSLQLLGAAGELVATVALDSPCGTVAGAVLSITGFPKTVTPALFGTLIASARLRTAAAADFSTGHSVGLTGSGAEVILSKLTPATGDTVMVMSGPTLTEG